MQLYAIGVNHTTAPIAIRENIAFSPHHLCAALNDLTAQDASEAAILSTCNRTEIYVQSPKADPVINWLANYHKIDINTVRPYLYTLSNQGVVKHAFRVASGLDSMALGEAQILGQFKQSIKVAQEAGTLGTHLHKLFQQTFKVAKEVRTNTDIGSSSISMAAAAVKLAQRIFGDISQQKILFIGAGEMIALCANHFVAQKPKSITVANRTRQRSEKLAEKVNAQAMLLNNLPSHFATFDIVITSTASQLPIVGLGMVERAIKARKHRPILMIDLAVPRDIEAEVSQLDDVFLYTVDDLEQVINEGIGNREQAAVNAEVIVAARVENFMNWLKKRNTVPTIKAIRSQAENIRQAELKKALKALKKGENTEKILENLSQAITNKFLHSPSHILSQTQGEEHAHLEKLLRQIYQINS